MGYAVNADGTVRMGFELPRPTADFQSEKTGSTPVGSANIVEEFGSRSCPRGVNEDLVRKRREPEVVPELSHVGIIRWVAQKILDY